MKHMKIKLGGIIQALFTLFHIYLAYDISRISTLNADDIIFMQMLNVGGIIIIGFFTYVSFFHSEDLTELRLGRLILWLIIVFYLSRAMEEIMYYGTQFSRPIFFICLSVSFLYIVILFTKIRKAETQIWYFLYIDVFNEIKTTN